MPLMVQYLLKSEDVDLIHLYEDVDAIHLHEEDQHNTEDFVLALKNEQVWVDCPIIRIDEYEKHPKNFPQVTYRIIEIKES